MKQRPLEKNKVFSLIADAVGLSHLIVCNILLVLGETTDYFRKMLLNPSLKLSGLKFVYEYIDRPVHAWLNYMHARFEGDLLYMIGVGEVVIILSSIFYGLICYLILRIFFLFFD